MHVMGRLLSRYKTKRPGPFLHVNININTNLDVNSVASYACVAGIVLAMVLHAFTKMEDHL